MILRYIVLEREVTNVNTCVLYIMNYIPLFMPLIHSNVIFTQFSCNLFLGGRSRRGRRYFLYVWDYLSDLDTSQIRHFPLCIHSGTYLTGNTVLLYLFHFPVIRFLSTIRKPTEILVKSNNCKVCMTRPL